MRQKSIFSKRNNINKLYRQSLRVDVRLRAYIDASGSCKDRQLFYLTLEESGPDAAFLVFSQRKGINPIWLPMIKSILDII